MTEDDRTCPVCGEPVEGSGVYWWQVDRVVHQGECNLKFQAAMTDNNRQSRRP